VEPTARGAGKKTGTSRGGMVAVQPADPDKGRCAHTGAWSSRRPFADSGTRWMTC
jgi:hypothetical protein